MRFHDEYGTGIESSFMKRAIELCRLLGRSLVAAALLAGAAGAAPAPARIDLVVLGVAQDAGYPQAGCDKACCRAA